MDRKQSKTQNSTPESGSTKQGHPTLRKADGVNPARILRPTLEWVDANTLRANPLNARTHPRKQINQLSAAIDHFNIITPILVEEDGQVVSGHAKLEAAKQLKLEKVPIIRISHLNKTQLRAFILADNKIAQNAGWDRERLSIELSELQLTLPALELNLEITGFSTAESDAIIADFGERADDSIDDIPDLAKDGISKPSDLFALGNHRLTVGDARDEQTFKRLMQSEKAEMGFHDPPYNVKINGHVGGRGRTKHREFAFASGEMKPDQYRMLLKRSLHEASLHTKDGGISYVCMDWRHIRDLLDATSDVYTELKNICVWTKSTPGQGSFYRSQHELVCVFKTGTAPHINTFELGQNGRNRSNVWPYQGANTFRAGRMDELKMHPTVKPVAMITDAMLDCSRRGSIVLDAFAGSGSTIVAAEKVGRRAFCIEIDPIYVDTAIRRWQALTGKDAVLEGTGKTFDELEASRKTSPAKPRSKKMRS